MLACLRPTLLERRANWCAERVHRRIDLQPLGKDMSRLLVSELLKKLPEVPAALRELVTGGAEGNPFYMEELVKMLIDQGAIETGEVWKVNAERLLLTKVPTTLTGVLQARLDGLPAPERLTLQQASVIGPVFWDRALVALDTKAQRHLAGAGAPRARAAPRGLAPRRPARVRLQAPDPPPGDLRDRAQAHPARAARQAGALAGGPDRAAGQRLPGRGGPALRAGRRRGQRGRVPHPGGRARAHADGPRRRPRPCAAGAGAARNGCPRPARGSCAGVCSRSARSRWTSRATGSGSAPTSRRWPSWPRRWTTTGDAPMRPGGAARWRSGSRTTSRRKPAARQAVEWARRAGDDEIRLLAQRMLAMALTFQGRPGDGRVIAEEALTEARALALRRVEGLCLNALSVMLAMQSDDVGALRLDQQSLAAHRAAGDRRNEAIAPGQHRRRLAGTRRADAGSSRSGRGPAPAARQRRAGAGGQPAVRAVDAGAVAGR